MSGPHPRTLIYSLAVAVAAGKSVAAWARANGVALRTAYGWYGRPSFKRLVNRYRRRYVDRALGLLARNLAKAVSEEIRIVEKGEGDPVRLQAARGVVADMISLSRHADVEERITELERQDDDDRSAEPGDPA